MLVEQLSLDLAQKLIAAVLTAAEQQGLSVAAYVVDSGGHLIAAARMDGVSYMIIDVARRKAITSFIFQLPSEDLKQITDANPVVAADLVKNPDICAVPGGVPIVVNGQCVGGLGVSGGSGEQDRALARQAVVGPS